MSHKQEEQKKKIDDLFGDSEIKIQEENVVITNQRRQSNRRVSFAAKAHIHLLNENEDVNITNITNQANNILEIATKQELPNSFSSYSSSEDETNMDFTEHVGKVIQSSNDRCDDMELTVPVGGFIQYQKAHGRMTTFASNSPSPFVVESFSDKNNYFTNHDFFENSLYKKEEAKNEENVTMDLTQIIHETIQNNIIQDRNEIKDGQLKKFLGTTGIKFLDSMSGLARRETLAMRKRESNTFTLDVAKSHIYSNSTMSLETQIFENACAKLMTLILGQRESVLKNENNFDSSNSILIKNFEKDEFKSSIISRLRVLKTNCRLSAKNAWYIWRKANIQETLLSSLDRMKYFLSNDKDVYSLYDNRIREAAENLNNFLSTLDTYHRKLVSKNQLLKESQKTAQIKDVIKMEFECLSVIDDEITRLEKEEQIMKKAIEKLTHQKNCLSDQLDQISATLHSISPKDSISIDETRSNFSLNIAVNGWRIVKLDKNQVFGDFLRGGPIRFRVHFNSQKTQTYCSIDLYNTKDRNISYKTFEYLQNSSSITEINSTIPKRLSLFISRFDIITNIEEQIMKLLSFNFCNATIVQSEQDLFLNGLKIVLLFFSYDTKVKFEIMLQYIPFCDAKIISFTNSYGNINYFDIELILKEHKRKYDMLVAFALDIHKSLLLTNNRTCQ